MEKSPPSIAHVHEMNQSEDAEWPSRLVPWYDANPPTLERKKEAYTVGRLRSCAYCGSMHPADLAAAIRAGAQGTWADWKYGWPHKAYFNDVPNPYAGMLEVNSWATYKVGEDWIEYGPSNYHSPPQPAKETTRGKFYTVHLMDAEPEDKETIEQHLGLRFEFFDDGRVEWSPSGSSK